MRFGASPERRIVRQGLEPTISRTISALAADAPAALRGIWLARTPEYEEMPWSADPPGTLTPLWDADRWRQWATDTGFPPA
jgi:hypothetical protein